MSCIALFGGIPASGKTALCEYFKDNFKYIYSNSRSKNFCCNGYDNEKSQIEKSVSPEIRVITFDDLCSVDDQARIVKTLSGWKNFRVELIEAAERYVCEICNVECCLQGPLTYRSYELVQKLKCLNNEHGNVVSRRTDVIFLVEDNFYYKSMRYAWFQVARRDGLGFCQIYLKCPVDLAIQRNASRYQKIPERLITTMEASIEYPDPERNTWEQYSLIVDTTKDLNYDFVMPMMQLIQTAASHPAEMIMSEKKVEAQMIASKNVIHQADKILRKLTGMLIKDLKARKNTSEAEAPIENILKCRHEILLQLKLGGRTLPQNVVQSIEESGINSENLCHELENELQNIFISHVEKFCNVTICNETIL